ncbi:MAG: DUF3039 domain-containing protein [Nitriliruptoraceae bacterium]
MASPTHLPTRTPTRAPAPVEPEHRPDLDDGSGDHDRFAHYVSKRDLERYRRKGTPVTALCGKRWKPDGDPSRYPMCPTCAEIAADRIAGSFGG